MERARAGTFARPEQLKPRAESVSSQEAARTLDAGRGLLHRLRAAGDHRLVHRHLLFGGSPVLIEVAGCALGEVILPLFDHLAAAGGATPALWIGLVDGSEPGLPARSAFGVDDLPEHRTVIASVDGRYLVDRDREVEVWLDRERQELLCWYSGLDAISIFDRAKPLCRLLALWYRDQGIQILHTGLVAVDGKGILLGGPGGAGKSTASLACLLSGFDFLGDDYVGLKEGGSAGWEGYSLYSSILVDAFHLERFPEIRPHAVKVEHSPKGKSMVLASSLPGSQLPSATPIRAVVLPRLGEERDSSLTRAQPGEALRRLAPTSLMLQVSPTREEFSRLGRLLRDLPCYWLELGLDPADVPGRIRRAVAEGVS